MKKLPNEKFEDLIRNLEYSMNAIAPQLHHLESELPNGNLIIRGCFYKNLRGIKYTAEALAEDVENILKQIERLT